MTGKDAGGILPRFEAEMRYGLVEQHDGKYADLVEWMWKLYSSPKGFYTVVSVAGQKDFKTDPHGSREIAEHVGYQQLAVMLADYAEVKEDAA